MKNLPKKSSTKNYFVMSSKEFYEYTDEIAKRSDDQQNMIA